MNLVDTALKKLKINKTELALRLGVSTITLRAWRLGLSEMKPENKEKLENLIKTSK